MQPVPRSNQPIERREIAQLIDAWESGSDAERAAVASGLEAAGIVSIGTLGIVCDETLHWVSEYVPTYVTALDGRVAALKQLGWRHPNGSVLRRAVGSSPG